MTSRQDLAARVGRDFIEPDSSESLAGLHYRVLRGETAAAELLAERLLPELERRLQRAFPRAGKELIANAAEDAILEYLRIAQRFDSSRGLSLNQFLRVAARRNLLNFLRDDARRKTRELRTTQELRTTSDAVCNTRPRASHLAGAKERCEAVYRAFRVADLNDQERKAARAWLAGEKSSQTLALLLGLGEQSIVEARKEVKRFKDRMVMRLRRALQRTRMYCSQRNR